MDIVGSVIHLNSNKNDYDYVYVTRESKSTWKNIKHYLRRESKANKQIRYRYIPEWKIYAICKQIFINMIKNNENNTFYTMPNLQINCSSKVDLQQ